jgi:hypothetical protein
MSVFNGLRFFHRGISGHFDRMEIADQVKLMLKIDPVIFFQEMRMETDQIFLLTFWNTFLSKWVFLCSDEYRKRHLEFKDYIIEITNVYSNLNVSSDMLYHFKCYLLSILATDLRNKAQVLFEAKEFYTHRLKNLIETVLNGKHGKQYVRVQSQLKEMDRNFQFYDRCIEKENIKYLLTNEFRLFKTELETDKKVNIQIHSENMIFLVCILMYDRSSIFGLSLIEDQSPEFIGYFLIIRYYQSSFLKALYSLEDEKPILFSKKLLKLLYRYIPAFEVQFAIANQKFKPVEEFTNDYNDILRNEMLIELAKTLFRKIHLL